MSNLQLVLLFLTITLLFSECGDGAYINQSSNKIKFIEYTQLGLPIDSVFFEERGRALGDFTIIAYVKLKEPLDYRFIKRYKVDTAKTLFNIKCDWFSDTLEDHFKVFIDDSSQKEYTKLYNLTCYSADSLLKDSGFVGHFLKLNDRELLLFLYMIRDLFPPSYKSFQVEENSSYEIIDGVVYEYENLDKKKLGDYNHFKMNNKVYQIDNDVSYCIDSSRLRKIYKGKEYNTVFIDVLIDSSDIVTEQRLIYEGITLKLKYSFDSSEVALYYVEDIINAVDTVDHLLSSTILVKRDLDTSIKTVHGNLYYVNPKTSVNHPVTHRGYVLE